LSVLNEAIKEVGKHGRKVGTKEEGKGGRVEGRNLAVISIPNK